MKDQYLNNDNLLSGQVVYLDHYIMRDQCRLYQMGGKYAQSKMISGGFFDHSSGFRRIKHQLYINATETV